MKTLKIYSKQKPNFLLSAETYAIDINGTKRDSIWYSEIEIDEYGVIKSMLEDIGYTAHPASSKEVESKEYTIFRETV